MTKRLIMPVLMGTMMGAMGLAMLHGQLTGTGSNAGLTFVLAHVAVIGAGAGLAFFGLHRRFPALTRVMSHRPSARHISIMLAAALLTAALIHLTHGGPTWT